VEEQGEARREEGEEGVGGSKVKSCRAKSRRIVIGKEKLQRKKLQKSAFGSTIANIGEIHSNLGKSAIQPFLLSISDLPLN
jgi:hypothetical protein